MAQADEIKFLGVALKNPPEIAGGTAVLSKGRSAVEESIVYILDTPIGTVPFFREFGSRVHELLFEQNDDVLVSMLQLFITDAIESWEKRVKLANLSFEIGEKSVNVIITYTVLNSNSTESFIFPFYKRLLN